MPKQNHKQRPPQRATLRRPAAGYSADPLSDYTEHHDNLLSLVDPFCSDAGSAKVPDIGAGRTMTEQVRFLYTAVSDASGGLYLAFVPKVDNILLTSAAGVYSGTYSLSNSTSLVVTAGTQYRITSMGVKIMSLLSATQSSGTLATGIGLAPPSGSTTYTAPDYFNEWSVHPVGDATEWHVVSKPDSTESLDWNTVNTSDGTNETPIEGWQAIFVQGSGLPVSTSSFLIEAVYNFEFKISPSSAMAKLCTAQPVYNPQLLVARNEAFNQVNHTTVGNRDKFVRHVKQEVGKAVVKHVIPFVKKKGIKAIAKFLV